LQEYIEEKCVAIVIRAVNITANLLAAALGKLEQEAKNQCSKVFENGKTGRGKQSAKELVGADDVSIEISDENIKAFDPIARKHNIKYELLKDSSAQPPKWTVLFKGQNVDDITAAFKEFTAKTLGKEKGVEKPSVVSRLKKAMENVKEQVVDKTRAKEHGGPEL